MGPKDQSGRRIVCHCLGVTEAELLHCIRAHGARTLKDVTRLTEAGDGCTACHETIRRFLARRSAGM